ncbi:MAG: invasion associated locus B family protein [Paracoccus sp. (in: a-proteobacteria)]|uniref:invasion associated locus B family protein n=1 Tax=Paracoccus sp. TaxID=267 RepID=UPI0026DFC986|nr:invasion associated locus B family protein [Paracoccus sp. (in: a-proteobacteria)]MDO5632914.1 invasion associated locus B family protein [Paracoccus sp. (in: a-proteobacteria)]
MAAAFPVSADSPRPAPAPDLTAPQVTPLPDRVTPHDTLQLSEAAAAPLPSPPVPQHLSDAPLPQGAVAAGVSYPIRQMDGVPQFRHSVSDGDWSFDCISPNPQQLGECTVKRDLVLADSTTIVAVLLIHGPAREGVWQPHGLIEVVVPPPVGIVSGVTLVVTDGPAITAPFAYCDATRCVARLVMPDGYVPALAEAGRGMLIWSAPDGGALQAGFSTLGLASVLGATGR